MVKPLIFFLQLRF